MFHINGATCKYSNLPEFSRSNNIAGGGKSVIKGGILGLVWLCNPNHDDEIDNTSYFWWCDRWHWKHKFFFGWCFWLPSLPGDVLKIADFGLAREIRSRPPYTEYVSTRWCVCLVVDGFGGVGRLLDCCGSNSCLPSVTQNNPEVENPRTNYDQ